MIERVSAAIGEATAAKVSKTRIRDAVAYAVRRLDDEETPTNT